MHYFRDEQVSLVESELALVPHERLHDLPRQLDRIGHRLGLGGQVGDHAHAAFVVVTFPDDYYDVIHVEAEVLAVWEELVRYFGNVLPQVLQIGIDMLVGCFSPHEYIFVIPAAIQTNTWMCPPLSLLRVVKLVLIPPGRKL